MNPRQRAIAEAARIYRTTSGPSAPFDALVNALARAYLAEEQRDMARAELEAVVSMPRSAEDR